MASAASRAARVPPSTCRALPPIAVTSPAMPDCSFAMRSRISSVAPAVCRDNDFSSPATTPKPRPDSPARAASMVAFNARRFVWLAICSMVRTIVVIWSHAAPRACTFAATSSTDARIAPMVVAARSTAATLAFTRILASAASCATPVRLRPMPSMDEASFSVLATTVPVRSPTSRRLAFVRATASSGAVCATQMPAVRSSIARSLEATCARSWRSSDVVSSSPGSGGSGGAPTARAYASPKPSPSPVIRSVMPLPDVERRRGVYRGRTSIIREESAGCGSRRLAGARHGPSKRSLRSHTRAPSPGCSRRFRAGFRFVRA